MLRKQERIGEGKSERVGPEKNVVSLHHGVMNPITLLRILTLFLWQVTTRQQIPSRWSLRTENCFPVVARWALRKGPHGTYFITYTGLRAGFNTLSVKVWHLLFSTFLIKEKTLKRADFVGCDMSLEWRHFPCAESCVPKHCPCLFNQTDCWQKTSAHSVQVNGLLIAGEEEQAQQDSDCSVEKTLQ